MFCACYSVVCVKCVFQSLCSGCVLELFVRFVCRSCFCSVRDSELFVFCACFTIVRGLSITKLCVFSVCSKERVVCVLRVEFICL